MEKLIIYSKKIQSFSSHYFSHFSTNFLADFHHFWLISFSANPNKIRVNPNNFTGVLFLIFKMIFGLKLPSSLLIESDTFLLNVTLHKTLQEIWWKCENFCSYERFPSIFIISILKAIRLWLKKFWVGVIHSVQSKL